jgi:nucleotide-binding universal stress UspA family protein
VTESRLMEFRLIWPTIRCKIHESAHRINSAECPTEDLLMKILLATDGSQTGTAAAEALENIRLQSGDEVKIVCIVDMAVPLAIDIYGGYLPDTTELEKAAKENAAKVLEETGNRVKGYFPECKIHVSTETLFGTPESRIVETAEEISADLIVIGSHGYNRWERLLLGSVSDSVVHHAHCSVLVVRTKAK